MSSTSQMWDCNSCEKQDGHTLHQPHGHGVAVTVGMRKTILPPYHYYYITLAVAAIDSCLWPPGFYQRGIVVGPSQRALYCLKRTVGSPTRMELAFVRLVMEYSRYQSLGSYACAWPEEILREFNQILAIWTSRRMLLGKSGNWKIASSFSKASDFVVTKAGKDSNFKLKTE